MNTEALMQNIDKLEVADEYLDLAIESFLIDKRYASTIHLAGAAQEIYGKWLRCNKEQDWPTVLLNEFEKKQIDEGKWFNRKELVKIDKHPKNSIKHLDNKNDRFTKFHLKYEAFVLLSQAVVEHQRLERQITPPVREFKKIIVKVRSEYS